MNWIIIIGILLAVIIIVIYLYSRFKVNSDILNKAKGLYESIQNSTIIQNIKEEAENSDPNKYLPDELK